MSSAITRLFLRLSRHVALHDAQGEPFDDRRLADARLADEHGVVLRAPREHLDHAADFLVAADHRVELALLGPLDEVDAVLFERLELVLRASDRSRAPTRGPSAARRALSFSSMALSLQHVLGLRLRAGEREQQVLGRDELVLHLVGFRLGRVEHLAELAAEPRRRAAAGLAADASARPRRSVRSCATLTPIFSSTGRTMPSLFVRAARRADASARSADSPRRPRAPARVRRPPGL